MTRRVTHTYSLLIVSILIVVIIISTQCDKGKKCENVICTDEFVGISLTLRYPDGQPVILDSCKVFWMNHNRYLEENLNVWKETRLSGYYPIVSDMMRKELEYKREVMRFTGYLNNKIVYKQDLPIGADCCHVTYLGTESLTQVIYCK